MGETPAPALTSIGCFHPQLCLHAVFASSRIALTGTAVLIATIAGQQHRPAGVTSPPGLAVQVGCALDDVHPGAHMLCSHTRESLGCSRAAVHL